jgi:uncharacterized protein (DUF885 family)
MKKTIKWIAALVAASIIAAAALAAQTWYGKPLSINWFYTKVFARLAIDNPELLTSLRLLEQVGLRGHNGKLTDASEAREIADAAQWRTDLATLKSYDHSGYSGQDRLSYDIFEYYATDRVNGERWRLHDFPVNQMFGVQSALPNLMTQQQQINDAKDAELYIERLGEFPRKLNEVMQGITLRESKGIVPPKFTVEKVLTQIKTFVATGAAGNELTVSFKEKIAKIPAEKMDAASRTAFTTRVESAVQSSVLPAYAALAAQFDALRSKATANHGAWSLPDGDAYYQYRIESNTTTTMTAAQIHALGLTEVARIGASMDSILLSAGYNNGTRAEKIAKLNAAPEQLYADSDDGRAQLLKDYQSIIDEISAGLDPHFKTQPKAKVVVKRVPTFTEASAPGAYYNSPPLDGSAPGTFYANLRDVKELPKYTMRSLAYHEAVPGHHLQISIAQEIKGLPIFRSLVPFTAYMEGWALYSEQLAWEIGYQKNPLDNLGRLRDEMMRAVRLVVDTGIHNKRWTREQAITYMVQETGMPESEVVTEIERYFVDPGQALAYKVGMLKILELRERAKTTLGAKFDIRDFHDTVLVNGAMPLAVLERAVDGYIAAKKAL